MKINFLDQHKSLSKFVKTGIVALVAWVVSTGIPLLPVTQETILLTAILTAVLNYLKHNTGTN